MSVQTPAITMKDAALYYISQGFPVIPLCWPTLDGKCGCGRGHQGRLVGKVPLTKHGLKDATQTQLRVKHYWGKWPKANIGIVIPPGYFVIDIDIEHGGFDSLGKLRAKHTILPTTWTIRTGSGGLHLWYKYKTAGVRNTTALAGYQGIDVRGQGGYVVAPPSLHRSGHRYEASDDATIVDAPVWLIELAAKKASASQPLTDGQLLPEGERDATLASLAGTMRRRGFTQAAIEAALREENKRCVDDQGRPKPLPDSDIVKIAKSVSRYPPSNSIYMYARTGQTEPESKRDKTVTDFLTTLGQDRGAPAMKSLQDMRDAIANEPEADDLIQDLLPDSNSAYMLIAGRSGIGKTFLLLNILYCLASGTPFMGRKTKRCKVGYLSLEGDCKKILKRFNTLGLSFPGAEDNIFWEHRMPFKLHGKGIDWLTAKVDGLAVVGIDPLRPLVPGDYTISKDVSAFIENLRTVQYKTGVVFIGSHHIRKPDKRIKVHPEDLLFEIKGASEYVESATSVLLLERGKQGRGEFGKFVTNTSLRNLHFVKIKDAPTEPMPLPLRFNAATYLFEAIDESFGDEA